MEYFLLRIIIFMNPVQRYSKNQKSISEIYFFFYPEFHQHNKIKIILMPILFVLYSFMSIRIENYFWYFYVSGLKSFFF